MIERKSLNHLLHIFLFFISAGIWILIYGWLLGSNVGARGKWVCTECGGESTHEKYKGLIEWKSGQRSPTWWESRSSNKAYRLRKAWEKRENKR